MRVSSINPSFNQAEYHEETIRSALHQCYDDPGYFTVDGRVPMGAATSSPGTGISSPIRRADGSIISTNGFSEITSAQGAKRQIRCALKLTF